MHCLHRFRVQVVGSLTLFFLPAPLLMKQCYLILTGGFPCTDRAIRNVLRFNIHLLEPCLPLNVSISLFLVFLSVGVVTAYVFTWIPEWTTWVLLLMMALYDVAAVLLPGGPLKMLVELAQEREEVSSAGDANLCIASSALQIHNKISCRERERFNSQTAAQNWAADRGCAASE